jgi:hypothetical protein
MGPRSHTLGRGLQTEPVQQGGRIHNDTRTRYIENEKISLGTHTIQIPARGGGGTCHLASERRKGGKCVGGGRASHAASKRLDVGHIINLTMDRGHVTCRGRRASTSRWMHSEAEGRPIGTRTDSHTPTRKHTSTRAHTPYILTHAHAQRPTRADTLTHAGTHTCRHALTLTRTHAPVRTCGARRGESGSTS